MQVEVLLEVSKFVSVLCLCVWNFNKYLTFDKSLSTAPCIAGVSCLPTFTWVLFVFPLVARGFFHKEGFWHITVASAIPPSSQLHHSSVVISSTKEESSPLPQMTWSVDKLVLHSCPSYNSSSTIINALTNCTLGMRERGVRSPS